MGRRGRSGQVSEGEGRNECTSEEERREGERQHYTRIELHTLLVSVPSCRVAVSEKVAIIGQDT